MSCLVKITLFIWGPWATTDIMMSFMVRALGHVVSIQPSEGLKTEVSYMRSQPCLHEGPAIKTLDMRAQGLATLHLYCHMSLLGKLALTIIPLEEELEVEIHHDSTGSSTCGTFLDPDHVSLL